MKPSPEPLRPMRQWRELWNSKSPISGQPLDGRIRFQRRNADKNKQPAFHWLNHLLNRDLPD